MSQEKVDKYKKEKADRKKNIKKAEAAECGHVSVWWGVNRYRARSDGSDTPHTTHISRIGR